MVISGPLLLLTSSGTIKRRKRVIVIFSSNDWHIVAKKIKWTPKVSIKDSLIDSHARKEKLFRAGSRPQHIYEQVVQSKAGGGAKPPHLWSVVVAPISIPTTRVPALCVINKQHGVSPIQPANTGWHPKEMSTW